MLYTFASSSISKGYGKYTVDIIVKGENEEEARIKAIESAKGFHGENADQFKVELKILRHEEPKIYEINKDNARSWIKSDATKETLERMLKKGVIEHDIKNIGYMFEYLKEEELPKEYYGEIPEAQCIYV